MKKIPLLLTLLILAGCSEEPKERTYTVDELIADDALRASILEKCNNNPGELGPSPNCVNAEDADWQARMQKMRE